MWNWKCVETHRATKSATKKLHWNCFTVIALNFKFNRSIVFCAFLFCFACLQPSVGLVILARVHTHPGPFWSFFDHRNLLHIYCSWLYMKLCFFCLARQELSSFVISEKHKRLRLPIISPKWMNDEKIEHIQKRGLLSTLVLSNGQ